MRITQAVLLATVALPLALPVQANDAYWKNKDGKILTSAKTGMCIRTVRWTEQKADRACLEKAKKEMMSMK